MLPITFPVACHTDHIAHGSIFVAIKGMKDDGINHIPLALAKGAKAVVVEQQYFSPDLQQAVAAHNATLITVDNTRKALAHLSAQAHNNPAQKLKIIAITGTKGKSTTTFLVEHIFKTAGYKTALLSTVKNRILDTDLPTQLTTQQPDYLHTFFATCVEHKVEYVVMEVAAQAHSLHRIAGLIFEAVIFTNFSQEHAEFYPTLDEYFAAKRGILEQAKNLICLNNDDEYIKKLLPHYPQTISYSCTVNSTYAAHIKTNSLSGLELVINNYAFSCPALIGAFNAYNITAAISLAHSFSIEYDVINQALQSFTGVPGRLEKYLLPNGATAFIDYAHNPSSYQALLSTLRTFTHHLIVVFGCGGERDATKRPMMGAIASQLADQIILTTDNPRSEEPQDIINNILAGISQENYHKVLHELDRQQAIKKAYALSKPGSIIALLGKGPDEYQLIKGVKYPFSEKSILKSLL